MVVARRSWLPWVAFAVIAAISARLLVVQVGNGLTFFYDEWEFLLRRRGVSPGVFLRPHGDHLSAVPIAIYKAMLRVFGLDYRPYQWMLMAFLIGLAAVVYLYARPRIGPWAALFPVVVILFGGSFWEDTLWPFQIGFIGALGFGVAAFLALDKQTLRWDVAASVLLLLAIASASVGLPFLGGVALELLLRRQWKRLWIVAVPLLLYAAWKVGYPHTDVKTSNISKTPDYVWQAAAGAFGSIFGLDRDAGKIMLYAGLALLLDAIIRGRSNVRLWALVTTALLFWIAAALARAQLQAPDVSRYLLPGATLVMLIVIEAVRGLRPNRTLALVLLALVPILYTHGKTVLQAGATPMILTWSPYLEADYKALDLVRPHLKIDPHAWHVDPQRAPDIDVYSYYGLIDTFGDPAPSFARLAQLPADARNNADAVIMIGSRTAPTLSSAPTTPDSPPKVVTQYWAGARPANGCLMTHAATAAAAAAGATTPYMEVAIPPQGIRFKPEGPIVSAGARLLGDDPQPFASITPGRWYSFKPPAVGAPRPWIARFALGTAPVRICAGG